MRNLNQAILTNEEIFFFVNFGNIIDIAWSFKISGNSIISFVISKLPKNMSFCSKLFEQENCSFDRILNKILGLILTVNLALVL